MTDVINGRLGCWFGDAHRTTSLAMDLSSLKERSLSSVSAAAESDFFGLVRRGLECCGRAPVALGPWGGRAVKAGRRPPGGEALTARSGVAGQWDTKSA